MSGAAGLLDSLIREYLVFRGFTATLKQFDAELKVDKEKGFKVLSFSLSAESSSIFSFFLEAERVVEHLCSLIGSYDISGLYNLWNHISTHVFLNLGQEQINHAKRLENDLYKLYLANCVQNKKPEKTREFFEQMANYLHSEESWREWFGIPYLPSPQEHASFRLYFSKQWQETYLVSLHNFLSLAFHQMKVPALLAYSLEQNALKRNSGQHQNASKTQVSEGLLRLRDPPPDVVASAEVLDDFYVISQSSRLDPNSESSAAKSLASVFRKKFSKKEKDTENKSEGLPKAKSTSQLRQ